MDELFQYRDNDYFEKWQGEMFVFHTIKPLLYLSDAKYDKGWWLRWHNPMMIKATTTPCFRLTELAGRKVAIKDTPTITGTIGGGGWGLNDSPFIYIYWDRIPDMKLGFPCALYNFRDLVMLDDTLLQGKHTELNS